jgi:mannose-6-phosphate isomerase-like protein (cupin superfamily)
MKRVVTGVDANGASYVVSADRLPDSGIVELWLYTPSDLEAWIAAIPGDAAATTIEPAPGVVRWVKVTLAPDDKPIATGMPGIEEDGFHVTRTIDLAYVLSGAITLFLDRESVEVEAGDVVVQQATRHAWRNDGPAPVEMLFLLHTPD